MSISGTVDLDDCTIVYTTDKAEDVIVDETITFNGDGITNHTITATVTHPTAPDSPVTATYVVELKEHLVLITSTLHPVVVPLFHLVDHSLHNMKEWILDT